MLFFWLMMQSDNLLPHQLHDSFITASQNLYGFTNRIFPVCLFYKTFIHENRLVESAGNAVEKFLPATNGIFNKANNFHQQFHQQSTQ